MTCKQIWRECKYAADVIERGIDLTDRCSNFWKPGLTVAFAPYAARPAPLDLADDLLEKLGYTPRYGQDGFEYGVQLSSGVGQAGRREPRWAADPITDGSITWLRQPLSALSLFRAISAPLDVEWIVPDEMTVTLPVFIVGAVIQIAAHFGGGVEGETHRVIARVPYSDGTQEDYGIDFSIIPSA